MRRVSAVRTASWRRALAGGVLGLALCAGAAGAADDASPAESTAVASRAPRAHNVLAWPVYVHWRGDPGTSVHVVGPATAWVTTPDERSFHLAYPFTGYRRFANGRRDVNLAWPVTHFLSDPPQGRTAFRLATPLVGFERRVHAGDRLLRVAPLFTNELVQGGRRRFELAPILYREDDSRTGRRVREFGYVPLLGGTGASLYRSWAATGAGGWSFAAAFGQARHAQTRWLWLGPYVSYDNTAASAGLARFRTFGGLWSSWDGASSRGWEAALVYGGGRSGGTSWLWLPPWMSYARTDSASGTLRFRTLAPLFVDWRSPRADVTYVFPSLWRYRSDRMRASGAWPLVATFRRARADSSEHEGGSFAWPLITWGHGRDWRTFGVLPLYYRLVDGPASLTLMPPFYGAYRGPGNEVRVAPPFWFRRRAGEESFEARLLWWRHHRPGHEAIGVFPFWDRMREDDRSSQSLWPIFHHARDPQGERHYYPGWAEWRSYDPPRTTRLIGPVVTTRGPDSRGLGIVPVFYSGSWPGARATLVGPVYWNRGPSGLRAVVVAPLAWWSRGRSGTNLVTLPLTGYHSGSDRTHLLFVLWPVYTHRRWRDGKARHSLLLGLGRDERSGPARRAWLQPFVYYDRPSARSSYLAFLGGVLASYEREEGERRLRLFMIPVRRWKA
jgi:hypothetical protein